MNIELLGGVERRRDFGCRVVGFEIDGDRRMVQGMWSMRYWPFSDDARCARVLGDEQRDGN